MLRAVYAFAEFFGKTLDNLSRCFYNVWAPFVDNIGANLTDGSDGSIGVYTNVRAAKKHTALLATDILQTADINNCVYSHKSVEPMIDSVKPIL